MDGRLPTSSRCKRPRAIPGDQLFCVAHKYRREHFLWRRGSQVGDHPRGSLGEGASQLNKAPLLCNRMTYKLSANFSALSIAPSVS